MISSDSQCELTNRTDSIEAVRCHIISDAVILYPNVCQENIRVTIPPRNQNDDGCFLILSFCVRSELLELLWNKRKNPRLSQYIDSEYMVLEG